MIYWEADHPPQAATSINNSISILQKIWLVLTNRLFSNTPLENITIHEDIEAQANQEEELTPTMGSAKLIIELE